MAAPYTHAKFAVIESKVEQTTEIVSRVELVARADKEIAEAFREWKSPVIEHQPSEPVTPTVSVQDEQPKAVVSRLPIRYRPPR